MGPLVALLHGLQVLGVLLLLLHTYGWSVAARNRRKSLDRLRSRRRASAAKQPQPATRKRGAQQPGEGSISTDDGGAGGDGCGDGGIDPRAGANLTSGNTTGNAESSCCPHWPAVAVVMPVRGFHAHTASNWATHITADYAGAIEFLIVVESEADPSYREGCNLAARFNAAHNAGREGEGEGVGEEGRGQREEGKGQKGAGGRQGGADGGEGRESMNAGDEDCGEEDLIGECDSACRQQGEVHLRKVRVVVAGTSTTCSQKIHNQLAGVAAARPEAEFVLFLDDDARMYPEAITYLVTDMICRPDTFLVTGYPFDIPNPGSLFSYAVLGFHLVPLVNFSYDAGTEYIWGGCMMLRLGDFRSNRLGMVDVLRKGGYSDDMTLGAVGNSISSSSGSSKSSTDRGSSSNACEECEKAFKKWEQQSSSSLPCRAIECAQRLRLSRLKTMPNCPGSSSSSSSPRRNPRSSPWSSPGSSNPPMLSPAYALLAHPLDPHFSFRQFWRYQRRQLFTLTTHFSPLNRRLNLWLLIMGIAFSSVMTASIAVSLSCAFMGLATHLLPCVGGYAAPVLAGVQEVGSLVAAAVCLAPAAGLPETNTTCSIPSGGFSPVAAPSPAAAAAAATWLTATNNTLGVYLRQPGLLLPLIPSLLQHTITHLSHLPLGVSLALLHLASFALASLALRAMIAAHIQTCRFLDPQAPIWPDRASVAVADRGKCDCSERQYALWRVWVGYLIHNSMYTFCALLTCWVPYIDWAGIRYSRRSGRIISG